MNEPGVRASAGPGRLVARVRRAAQRLLGRREPTAWRAGEDAAANHLKRAGYRVLGRNVLVAGGEIDLVCESADGRTVVVVEVKARIDTGGPRPEASVTRAKQTKLRRLALALVRAEGWSDRAVRIDVIGVDLRADLSVSAIRHHAAAV